VTVGPNCHEGQRPRFRRCVFGAAVTSEIRTPTPRPGYNVPIAEQIKRETGNCDERRRADRDGRNKPRRLSRAARPEHGGGFGGRAPCWKTRTGAWSCPPKELGADVRRGRSNICARGAEAVAGCILPATNGRLMLYIADRGEERCRNLVIDGRAAGGGEFDGKPPAEIGGTPKGPASAAFTG